MIGRYIISVNHTISPFAHSSWRFDGASMVCSRFDNGAVMPRRGGGNDKLTTAVLAVLCAVSCHDRN